MSFWKPKFMSEWLGIFREKGFRGFIKEKGWKIVLVFFLYYLVRDSLVYIIIPYLVINNIIQCN